MNAIQSAWKAQVNNSNNRNRVEKNNTDIDLSTEAEEIQ